MELIPISSLLDGARRGHYAVGAFNYCNAETCLAVIETACELRAPLILIIGPWEISLLGVSWVARIAQMAAQDADVPVCLHLDHATDFDLTKQCIEAGFPSVMIDGSQHDFEDNVRLTKQVVDLAHPRGVTVEGELGAVGRVGVTTTEGAGEASMTDPAKAAEFVERTGVDALAVALGNAHGLYTQRPVLDFDRLEAIGKAVDVPLVLHGGSGTPSDQLHRAIDLGICKVNVASDLAHAYVKTFVNAVGPDCKGMWYAHAIAKGKEAVKVETAKWMRELGCAGRAGN